VTMTT